MIVQVPITPVNLRFLRGKHNFTEVYNASRRHPDVYLLMELMVSKPRTWEKFNPDGMHVLDIELPDEWQYRYRVHLPAASVTVFNTFVYELMKSEFIAHMYGLVEVAGFDIDEAIYEFIEKYQFDSEEVSFEMLKQHFYRYRRRMEGTVNR